MAVLPSHINLFYKTFGKLTTIILKIYKILKIYILGGKLVVRYTQNRRVLRLRFLQYRTKRRFGMYIRKAVKNDLPAIMAIYKDAKVFMERSGNPTQWAGGHPKESLIENDIESGTLYVCVDGETIMGVFAFIIGPDPTYRQIWNGEWHSAEQYGTIHRLASAGKAKGMAKACFDFCHSQCRYLRVDTHRDNQPMQRAIRNYGFAECGIIHIADGSERIAFDYL